ncbi:unnamed protein product [Penicillium olsonii]|nr:unnamed protein product [Penicillium olsonii]
MFSGHDVIVIFRCQDRSLIVALFDFRCTQMGFSSYNHFSLITATYSDLRPELTMLSQISDLELVPRADSVLDVEATSTFPGPRLLAATSPLPLTTTFTPASECLNDLWLFESVYTVQDSTSWSTRWANLGPEDTKRCLPPGWEPSTFYSPGLVCPTGWAMAPGSTINDNGETTATCCPVYQPSSLTFTQRSLTSGPARPWHSTEACAFGAPTDIPYTYTATPGHGSKTTIYATATARKDGWNAYGIELRWKATDLTSISSIYVPSITSSATPQTTTQQQPEESSTLSTGAKAGIGIGAAIGGILVILAIGFLIIRRRKSKVKDTSEAIDNGQHELHGPRDQKHELDSNSVARTNDPHASFASPPAPVELESRIPG